MPHFSDVVTGLDIGYVPLAECLFEAVGPVRATTMFFFSASYAAIIFPGDRQNSEGNVNSYLFFVIYIVLMYKIVQLHA